MAEFRFYGDETDDVAILKAAFSISGNLLTPDLKYPRKKCSYYSSLSGDLLASLQSTRRLFVTGDFTVDGLCLSDVSLDDQRPVFVVKPESSEQTFSLTLPSSIRSDGQTSFGPGLLFLPREYIGDQSGVRPTDSTAEAYAATKRAIKRLMASKTIGRRKVTLTQKAKTTLEEDNAVILLDGWWVSGKGVKVRSNTGF
jgi:hypothetical protein